MRELCSRIAESETFQTFILALILITAGCMGLETFPDFAARYESFLTIFFYGSQTIFIIEIVIRLLAYAPRFKDFFSDRWNIFDFVIIVGSCIPEIGPLALIARLLRVVRVLRVVSVSDRIRGFISRLGESVDEACYSTVIVALLGYIFSIAGYGLFSETMPEHWGSLGKAGLSMFYLLLLQNVPEIVTPLVAQSGSAILFFIVFYVSYLSFLLAVVNAAITQSNRGRND